MSDPVITIEINEYGQLFEVATTSGGERHFMEFTEEDLWEKLDSFGIVHPARVTQEENNKRVMELEFFFCAVRGLASFFLTQDNPKIDLFLHKFDKMLEKVGLGDD